MSWTFFLKYPKNTLFFLNTRSLGFIGFLLEVSFLPQIPKMAKLLQGWEQTTRLIVTGHAGSLAQ